MRIKGLVGRQMMRLLRKPSLIGVVALALLLFIGVSFIPCLHVESSDCCQTDKNCNAPICGGGSSCHCACAFSGTPVNVALDFIVPTLIDEISVASPIQTVFDLTGSLDRPPRFS